LKLHRISIVVGEGKSELFHREFVCNATNDYYILPNDKRVKKTAVEKVEVHGISHDRYFAVIWLFNTEQMKEHAASLRTMAEAHFAVCEKEAHAGYELAKAHTVYPEILK
jgi:hypothetical protein